MSPGDGSARADLAEPTDRRLLRAAERLFAARGIDAVSLRAIMAAADANIASVHYHFGSKEALIEALIAERSGQISARRAELLDAIAATERPTARQLSEAFVRPVAELARSGGTEWVAVIAGIVGSNHPALHQVAAAFTPQARRFTALLERIAPGVPARTIRFRLTQAMNLTFQTLGNPEQLADMLALSGPTLTPDETLAELTDTVTAILSGPPDQSR